MVEHPRPRNWSAIEPAPSESESGSTSDLDAGASVLGLDALVDFKWEISVGDQILSFDEFQALVAEARRGPVLRRVHDQWVELDPEVLADAAARLAAAREGQGTILEAMRMAWEGEEGGIPLTGIEASGWVSELLDSGSANYTQVEQPDSLQGELRPYQQRGLSWLAFLDRFGLGSCLADDMGLGKTVQLLALLLHERKGGATWTDALGRSNVRGLQLEAGSRAVRSRSARFNSPWPGAHQW